MNKPGKTEHTKVNSIGMELVMIPPGSFKMGGEKDLEKAEDHENPIHPVFFSEPLWMGKCAVTQAQWTALMNDNPSTFQDGLRPVETVSWHDAQEFIQALNHRENTDGYRLPAEAEWEYAARAGSQSAYTFGSEIHVLEKYAWYRKNSRNRTQPVGRLEPNGWGLYDMHGNVHEWCQDWFDRAYYRQSPEFSPVGPSEGLARTLRGGDWGSEGWYCRCASRSLSSPDRRSSRVGFRLACTVS